MKEVNIIEPERPVQCGLSMNSPDGPWRCIKERCSFWIEGRGKCTVAVIGELVSMVTVEAIRDEHDTAISQTPG